MFDEIHMKTYWYKKNHNMKISKIQLTNAPYNISNACV